MGYKIIDGVAYELKEVNVDAIRKELKKEALEIAEAEEKISKINSEIDKICSSCDSQIKTYEGQILKLNELIQNAKDKKERSILPFKEEIANHNAVIAKAKLSLLEKKDIIELILPEESKKLGF